MPGDREQTAYCGLYCGDCIPSHRPLFDAAARLQEELARCQFGEYAGYKSRSDRVFGAFETFQKVLDAIPTLQCQKTCFHSGGNPNCAIRACVREKRIEGCWQCAAFETCVLLEPMSACHGDTVRHNLRMIRQLGVENWAHRRGKHYVWTEPDEPRPLRDNRRLDAEPYKVDFESIPWESPVPGLRFKAYQRHGRSLRLAEFTRAFVEPEWCIQGHVGYVLEGKIEVDFCGKEVVLFRTGDGLSIPPGSEHGHKARVRTDSVTLVLVEECGI